MRGKKPEQPPPRHSPEPLQGLPLVRHSHKDEKTDPALPLANPYFIEHKKNRSFLSYRPPVARGSELLEQYVEKDSEAACQFRMKVLCGGLVMPATGTEGA